LVEEAVSTGLEALAITDHDTLAGYDSAAPFARASGLDLVCGIEISTRFHGRSVHLLGYFVNAPPTQDFREWLLGLQRSRRERNSRLIDRLRSLGVDISMDEVESKGRSLTGRPHFAKVLVEKGYVTSTEQAFEEYLDESAKGYVQRQEVPLHEGIERVLSAGGVPSLAHPIRVARRVERGAVNGSDQLETWVSEMRDMGLRALEVFHSDHRPEDTDRYLDLARRFDMAVTGGSDFHGGNKPLIQLGRGFEGNLNVPRSVLDRLREL
jgi:predicted metal-dependent phosphoesterase TrpH